MASILKVDTIQDQDGNNIINESGDTITIGASGDTITVPTGASLTVPSGGLSGQNYPAWRATMSTAQTNNPSNVGVLVAFDTEDFDTDNAYTNTASNYKFTVPTGKAGKYYIGANVNLGDYQNNADFQQKRCIIYVNGSQVSEGRDQFASAVIQGSTNNFIGSFTIQDLSEGDYVQVYAQVYNTAFDIQTSLAEFYGFRIGA